MADSFHFSDHADEFTPLPRAPPLSAPTHNPIPYREEAKAELKRLKQSRYEAGERGQIHLSDIVLSQLAVKST
jgi:hypothetical protein